MALTFLKMPEILKDFLVATAVVTSLIGVPAGGLLWGFIDYGIKHPEVLEAKPLKSGPNSDSVRSLPFLAPEPFGH